MRCKCDDLSSQSPPREEFAYTEHFVRIVPSIPPTHRRLARTSPWTPCGAYRSPCCSPVVCSARCPHAVSRLACLNRSTGPRAHTDNIYPSFGSAHAESSRSELVLTIEPAWVRRGQSAQLHCDYELSGAPLYSVKWYRGNLEFYRYSPFENPPAKIFPYTGIKVDVST